MEIKKLMHNPASQSRDKFYIIFSSGAAVSQPAI
jgi:hypothetical protein